MASDQPSILRPIPRRNFEITPASPVSSSPPSPLPESSPQHLDPRSSTDAPPSRTRSILNLTSSTLFGIYSPTGYGDREEPSTPWGTGAQTPIRQGSGERLVSLEYDKPRSQRRSSSQHRPHNLGFTNFFLPLALRSLLLFAFGIAYGIIITHLHDDQRLAPVKVEGINRHDWRYLVFWGVAGVGLGSLLPWVDLLWEEKLGQDAPQAPSKRPNRTRDMDDGSPRPVMPARAGSGLGADWNPVVRSVGAFVGIAFAIRKLPWQSTLQVSLTLALVNPVLWYLIDRSKPGFLLSAVVGLTGTAVLLGINPAIVPAPATTASPAARASGAAAGADAAAWPDLAGGLVSSESIGVGTWIASVLFCSCVCFGNIGRRLALKGGHGTYGA